MFTNRDLSFGGCGYFLYPKFFGVFPTTKCVCWFLSRVTPIQHPRASWSYFNRHPNHNHHFVGETFIFVHRKTWKHPVFFLFSSPLLVGGLEHFSFSHILGIIIPNDFHIFQRGSNHQPVFFCGWFFLSFLGETSHVSMGQTACRTQDDFMVALQRKVTFEMSEVTKVAPENPGSNHCFFYQ